MNRNNYVPIKQLTGIAREEGCLLEQRTTCIRIKRGDGNNNRLYIHGVAETCHVERCANCTCTRLTCRVHINGFHIPDPDLAMAPPGGPVGTFVQMVRFDLPTVKILENFRHICRNLDKFVPDPKKPRQRPAGLRGTQRRPIENVVQEIQVAAQETPQQTIDRLVAEFTKKKETCQKMGFPMSDKTIKEYRAKIEALGGAVEAIA